MKENKQIEFEITKLVVEVYNKIAHWRNTDFDDAGQESNGLKVVSQDIVQTVLQKFASEIGVQSTTEVFRGDKKIGDVEAMQDPESFKQTDDKDVFDKLFNK